MKILFLMQMYSCKVLVGQINQNEKSAQLFDLIDEVGKLVKNQLDKAGKSYVKKGFNERCNC